MVRDREKYKQAVEFRKRGFTYSEIAKIVGVSKATVSNWLSKKPFSKRVREDNERRSRRDNVKRISLVNKARVAEREARYKEAARSAKTEFKHYRHSPLFLTGLSLYLASGDISHPTRIRLPGQRPEVQRVFRKFLSEFLGIAKKDIYAKRDLTIVDNAVSKKKIQSWCELVIQTVNKE